MTRKDVKKILRFYYFSLSEIKMNNDLLKEIMFEDNEEIQSIKARINYLHRLRVEIKKEVDKLESLKKMIIFDAYMNSGLNCNWLQISRKYHYSIDSCRHFAYDGIKELSVLFECNKIIVDFFTG